jgi:phage terminase large subunit-like protein
MQLWKLYDRQKEALKVVEENKFTLLLGQGRASKSCFAIWYIFMRAWKHPNTTHIIFRNTLSSAVDGIWAQTVKEVITHFYPILPSLDGFKVNESSHTITFPNGSRILLRGLDTPERATKVLSQQFATCMFDESQTIDYTYFALLLTRLPQPLDVDWEVKVLCTANYSPKTHWTKLFFSDGVNPETKVEHELNAKYLKFTTDDNKSIDAEEYIHTLNAAGDRRARLMCASTDWFEEIEGALWSIEDILRADQPEDFDDIVVSFDPAVTKAGDGHGGCVAGRSNDKYYVLHSFDRKADVNDIAIVICELYHEYDCSRLIVEVNNGGDWIGSLIATHDPSVYCETVRATRGKITRAEPISALYTNKLVYHCKRFNELEDQMCTYTGNGDSPNALDALVWALKYLSENISFVDPNNI